MTDHARRLLLAVALLVLAAPSTTPAAAPQHPPRTPNALVGPLRVEGRSFADASGPRTVFFCSWFPALRIWRDDREAAVRELDAIARAGWQGIRVFTAVGGWQPFWDGREVAPVRFRKQFETGTYGDEVPAWPDYDEQLRTFFAAVRARGLRLHLTTGDAQLIFPGTEGERAFHRRVIQLAREEGGSEVVALYEVWNEGWQNNAFGQSAEALDHARAIAADVKAAMPDVLTALSAAPPGLGEQGTATWSEGADVAVVHGTREPPERALVHAFDLVHRDGAVRTLPRPIWQGEPTGPDGARPEVFVPTNDPGWLFALFMVHQMTGQASVYFSGPGLRYAQPLAATWGFAELPSMLALLPRDIGQWRHVSSGPRDGAPLTALQFAGGGKTGPEGLFQVWNDRQVVALVYGGNGPWELAAVRPLRRWRVVGPDGIEHEGTGEFPLMDSELRARVVLGEF